MPPHPDPRRAGRMTARRLIIQADGGSRGNPGTAGYGAVVLDAVTGEVPAEVRMDSKLVVEQMSGRWQIKHPDLRPLAAQARQAARALGRVTYTWVPRERNTHADRLDNQAMDAV